MLPSCDAIVVTHDSRETIKECADALTSSPHIRQVIIVDTDSTDDTTTLTAGLPVSTITGPNCGFGHACNAGAQLSDAELLLFVNPDCTLRPSSVECLIRSWKSAAAAGVEALISPSFDHVDPRADEGFRAWLYPTPMIVAKALRRPTCGPATIDGAQRLLRAQRFSGAAFLVRRSLFEHLGGFDTGFFLYFEDADLAWRAASQGAISLVDPDAVATHVNQHSTGRVANIDEIRVRSNFHYAKKRHGSIGVAVLAVDIAISSALLAAADSLRGEGDDARRRLRRLRFVLPTVYRTLRRPT